jgi:hypothetical protein
MPESIEIEGTEFPVNFNGSIRVSQKATNSILKYYHILNSAQCAGKPGKYAHKRWGTVGWVRSLRVDKSWMSVARTVWETNERRVVRPNPAVVFSATLLYVGVLSQAAATLIPHCSFGFVTLVRPRDRRRSVWDCVDRD